jgi:hypothetical protein
MKGTIVTRALADGSKRYFAVYRADGRQRWKGFDQKKAAERFLTEQVRAVQTGTYREIRPVTFKDFAEQWMRGLGNLKPSTARSYRSTLEHGLFPALHRGPRRGPMVASLPSGTPSSSQARTASPIR